MRLMCPWPETKLEMVSFLGKCVCVKGGELAGIKMEGAAISAAFS